MMTELTESVRPIVQRFRDDIQSHRYAVAYDPVGDMATLTLYRPAEAITVRDDEAGLYLDVDPEQARVVAVSIPAYLRRFARRFPSPGAHSRRRQFEVRGLQLMLPLLALLGVDQRRFARRFIDDAAARRALDVAVADLERNPALAAIEHLSVA